MRMLMAKISLHQKKRGTFVESLNTAQYVYEQLMDEISKGVMKPGQHLPAIPISQKYGVSRTPVLEALRRMEADGIAVSFPGKGTCLIDPTPAEVREFFVVRALLEKKAMELSAQNPGLVFVSQLRESIEEEKKMSSPTANKSKFIKASLEFHCIVANACGNTLLQKYIHNVLSNIYVFQMLLYDTPTAFDEPAGWFDHEYLLELIKAKEVQKACDEVEHHILTAYDLMSQGR